VQDNSLKIFDFKKKKADRLHAEARRLHDEGSIDAAIAKYLEVIALDPDKSESYYNLGLIYKYQGEWQKSFDLNQKAHVLNPEDEAARWNLAIAATALRNWAIARQMWQENGMTLEGSEGPIEMDFGSTPVRLNPDDQGEVVWARRIDPVRARIENVPFPESGFRHGDVVLHDGAAVGYRKLGDREYPVFNVLEVFTRSPATTRVATVSISSESDLDALDAALAATQSCVEDWTQSVQTLCRACSEGRPHDAHDQELENEAPTERRLGIAVYPGDDIERILNEWQKSCGGKILAIEPESPH
jgi:tetratricopeptide (TPR) repeat protein